MQKPDMDLSERDTVALDAIGDTKTAVFLTGFHKSRRAEGSGADVLHAGIPCLDTSCRV